VVAISLGVGVHDDNAHHRSFLQYWEQDHQRRGAGAHGFYNVMWIEWSEGIAYRKAIGRVHKDLWNNLPLEEIDILLG
jgi:hypothetical protein